MLAAMNRLEIDEGIRDLVRQLWKHCYRTTNSCEGHGSRGYIMFKGGDGWQEEKAPQYGLEKYVNNPCCETQSDEIRCCGNCGAGVNGNSVYRGMLVQTLLKPEF